MKIIHQFGMISGVTLQIGFALVMTPVPSTPCARFFRKKIERTVEFYRPCTARGDAQLVERHVVERRQVRGDRRVLKLNRRVSHHTHELKAKLDGGEIKELFDVRTEEERAIAQIEGTHFRRAWLTPADLGYRAAMASVSEPSKAPGMI